MASQNIHGSTIHPRRPYADHIEATYGDSQEWLVNSYGDGYAARRWPPRDTCIDIHIVDNIGGTLSCQSFRPYHVGEVEPRFTEALDDRPPESKTRLLLFQCSELADTNTAYLDAIGWKFQLHPLFFGAHLQRAFYLTEYHSLTHPRELPVALPSEEDWISVVTDWNSFMTAHVISSATESTGMLWDPLPVSKLN